MKNLPLSRIMTRPMVSVAPEATLHTVSTLMEKHGVHHLLVMEHGRMIGIVSSADLLKVALLQMPEPDPDAAGMGDDLIRVRDIMQSRVAVLQENASLKEAARALLLGGFHALPVVAVDGSPVGMITSSDLAGLLIDQIERDAPVASIHARQVPPRAELQALLEVLRAAEVYLHSGQSEQQHARLVRAVWRAREMSGAAGDLSRIHAA
jgi:acetoin utilization protein AcuB